MIITNATITVKTLQTIAGEWANQFKEKKPELSLTFHVTPTNQLAVNGIVICPITEANAEAATYDAEFLYIPTHSGSEYEIYLHLPYEGTAEIGYITRITTVYCADSLNQHNDKTL